MKKLFFILCLFSIAVPALCQPVVKADSTTILRWPDLRKDSFYIKSGTDSVFRKSIDGSTRYAGFRTRIAIYDGNGLVSPMVRFYAMIVQATTGNGQSIDISSVGFTQVLSVQAQVETNTSTANDVPIVTVKSFTNTSVVLNVVQGNSTGVSILGVNVLGLRFLQTPANTKIHLLVVGY